MNSSTSKVLMPSTSCADNRAFLAKIRHLFVSPGHNFFGHHGRQPDQHPSLEVQEIECVAGRGIRGDRFFDFKENYSGQISFFSQEVFDAMCRELKFVGKSPSLSRRNIIVEGIDLNSLIGMEFEIQKVRFRGIAECSPCYWMDRAFGPGAQTFLRNCGGLRAQILSTGKIRVNG